MSLDGLARPLAVAVCGAALLGPAALAQRSPLLGLPLTIAVCAVGLWLLLRYGADL